MSTSNYDFSLNTNIHLNSNSNQPRSTNAEKLEFAIVRSYDMVSPLRKINIKPNHKPWVSADIRALMQKRDKAYHLAVTTQRASYHDEFKQLRSDVSNLLDTAKSSYISKKLKDAPNARSKWRELDRLGLTKIRKPSPLMFFTPQVLNQHFASACSSNAPLVDSDLQDIIATHLLHSNCNSFDFTEVSDLDVLRAIQGMQSKSSGVDGISLRMIKLICPTIVSSITLVINSSIREGCFPHSWKKALLLALSKIKTPLSPSDTRPIAQLPEISKILEKIAFQQLSDFLEANNILDSRQAGYRKGHSTQTALLAVTEDARDALGNDSITLLVLFDFSKAFDSIPHKKLLKKLRKLCRCSDRSLRCFLSYLYGRLQAMIDEGGSVSAWLKTLAGVPQGSVLDPLLFLIYINDLPNVLRFCKHIIFADDTQIYIHCLPYRIDEAIVQLNNDVEAVAAWAKLLKKQTI